MTAKSLNTMLAGITHSSSGQDEIDILKEIKSLVAPETYLASLFSDDLVKWAESQIKSDFPADIYGLWRHSSLETENVRAAWKKDATTLTYENERLLARITIATNDNDQLRATNAELQGRLARSDSAIQDLMSQKDDLEDQLNVVNYTNESQIMKLKAMIFDLEHPAR